MLWRRKGLGEDDKLPAGDQVHGESEEIAAPPLKPFTKKGVHIPARPVTAQPATPVRGEIPRRLADIPGANTRRFVPPGEAEGKKLVIGKEICLSGEISACDRLIVEGRVEAQMNNATILEIAESGIFKGGAEVDEAEISGRFEGNLTARKKLTIKPSGRVIGQIRYGRILVEAGAEISGSVELIKDNANANGRPLLTAITAPLTESPQKESAKITELPIARGPALGD